MSMWRIWYTNGYIDGSSQEEWNAAPDDEVQGVAEFFGYDEYGRKSGAIHSGSDWYWMDNGTICANYASLDEPNVWLEHNAPATAVLKKGRYTTQERIDEVDEQIKNWVN